MTEPLPWFASLRASTPLGKLSEADGLLVVAGLVKIGGKDGLTFRDTGHGTFATAQASITKLEATQ